MITYQGLCKVHPHVEFPARADRLDAREDITTHMHTPHGHHVDIRIVRGEPTEVDGFPEGGYSRRLWSEINSKFSRAATPTLAGSVPVPHRADLGALRSQLPQ